MQRASENVHAVTWTTCIGLWACQCGWEVWKIDPTQKGLRQLKLRDKQPNEGQQKENYTGCLLPCSTRSGTGHPLSASKHGLHSLKSHQSHSLWRSNRRWQACPRRPAPQTAHRCLITRNMSCVFRYCLDIYKAENLDLSRPLPCFGILSTHLVCVHDTCSTHTFLI